jgi:hypothetical protein
VVALSAVVAGAAAGFASAPVPVLGNARADTHGFGHPHPSLMAAGPGAM